MRRSPCVFTVVVATVFGLALAGCGKAWPETEIDPTNPAKVAIGKEIYKVHCAACHGAKLEGQPEWRSRLPNGRLPAPPHDESGHTWHHTDEQLFAMTRDGIVPPLAPPGYESDMPAFAAVLSDDEIRAVLAYIQSTWPEEVIAHRRKMLEQMRDR